jgi:hypothetical protein
MKSHIIASSSDQRLATLANAGPVGNEIVFVGGDKIEIGHFLDIGAGGKSLFRSGDNDGADLVIVFKIV